MLLYDAKPDRKANALFNLLSIQQRLVALSMAALYPYADAADGWAASYRQIPSNTDDYHVTDSLYLPHSVAAFCNGHSDAVAMKPWRRLRTRVLWSSPLQQGTIVPPCVNGIVFVSLVPISVPKANKNEMKKDKKTMNKRTFNHENIDIFICLYVVIKMCQCFSVQNYYILAIDSKQVLG